MIGRVLAACSIALAVVAGAAGQAPAAAPPVVLFALGQGPDGSFLLEPLLERVRGRLRMPPRVDEGNHCRAFPPAYTGAGKRYSVLFGGARIGTATFESGGKVAVALTRAIRAPEMALATDSKTLGRATGSRRPPTAEERAAAVSLARSQYRQKGVPSSMLGRFAIEQVASTDVNGDGAQDLIGAFKVDEPGGGRSHSLFFVAERSGGAYRLSLVEYHAGGGETYEFEQLVDHVDLDGDGSDELITRSYGWEWYTYRVYARRGGRWIRIYEGHGCEGV